MQCKVITPAAFVLPLAACELTHKCLREIVVWIYDTFDNNLEIKDDFEKYLKEYCW